MEHFDLASYRDDYHVNLFIAEIGMGMITRILYHQSLLTTIVAAAVMCAGRRHQCLYYNAIVVLDGNDGGNGVVEHVNGNNGDGIAGGWYISTV